MPKTSAGILMYRTRPEFEVFLAHPGGPFWRDKDIGAWTIPKGLVEDEEEHLAAAIREFEEETGIRPEGPFIDLGTIRQKSGKIVQAWACEGAADPSTVKSIYASVRWQGRYISVPEVDRCEWFRPEAAMLKLNTAQAEFVVRLLAALQS